MLFLGFVGVVAGTHLAVEADECPNDCAGFFKRLDGDGIQETKFQLRGGDMYFTSALNTLMCAVNIHGKVGATGSERANMW